MALLLHDLTVRFRGQLALDRVSLHVRRGDCYGFLGHNGAGKTTALRVALGLLRPQGGQVWVDGWSLARNPREVRARIGALVESPGFHGDWEAARNLVLLARLQGLTEAEARAEAARLLALVGLGRVGRKPVRAFSLGMRQRLGVAQALLGRPPYLLLDEPTNGLDPEGIAEVRELLRRLQGEEGTTILLSSHQLHEVAGLCNRVGVLRQGRLLVEEAVERLQGDGGAYMLRAANPGPAREALGRLGLAAREAADGSLRLDLGGREPAAAARALVTAGVEVVAFGPAVPTLEEIYLRHTRGEAGAGGAAAPPPAPEAPGPRLAPRRPLLLVFRSELDRLAVRGGLLLLALPPVAGGAGAVWLRWRQARAHAGEVARGEVFSTTAMTAFEAMAVHLGLGLWLAMVTACLLASQSLAGELSRGTLRNLLVRPVRRLEAALGKIGAQLAVTVWLYGAAVGSAFLVAGLCFRFTDLVEILPNGQPFPLKTAGEIWPELWACLWLAAPPLLAFSAVGFLAGAVARSGVRAQLLAGGTLLGLELGRTVGRSFGWERWLLSAYLPSPLADTSAVGYFADVAQGASNAVFRFAGTALLAPLVWLVLPLLLAVLILQRRYVP